MHRLLSATLALAAICGAPVAVAQTNNELRVTVANFGREVLDLGLTSTQDLQYSGHIHDPLIAGDETGKLTSDRGLAESWEMSADAMSLTVKLREGIRWHDGKPFTSDDVVFSLGERFIAPDANCTFCRFLRSGLSKIEAQDARTVILTLKNADPTFPSILSSRDGDLRMLARHNYRKTGEGYELVGPPLGTGPWRFEAFNRGVEMLLTANKDYWDKARTPQFDGLRILPRAQASTRLAMVRTGEVDMAFIDPRQATDALKAGLRLLKLEGASISVISFMGCWQKAMLCHEQKLRAAIAHAIDVGTILKRYYPEGTGRPVANSIWTEPALGFDPEVRPYAYDPAHSRELLKELNYDGRLVKLWSVPTNSNPEAPEIMQLIEGYLRAVGFKTELTPLEFGAFRPRYANDPQNFETRYAAHLYVDSPAARPTVLSNLAVSFISRPAGGIMQAYWNPAKIDEAYSRIRKITDIKQLDAELREVNRFTHSEYSFVTIGARAVVAAVGPRIQSWSPGNFGMAWNLETVKRAN